MIERALYQHAINDPVVASLIGDRFYPVTLPPNVTLPCATYHLVVGTRLHSLQGPSGHATPTYLITAFGSSFEEILELGDALRTSFDGFSGVMGTDDPVRVDRVHMQQRRDDFDPDLQVFWREQRFAFAHAESVL